ncbi:MAG: hypothetical protein COW01_09465 [Bdellovibrionales bacterium CG12_big_fil_rev_8_21_14_0_65_38_15]|nr:MAG: hypothetical protein COW79_09470 [Bdellovibrionales bacterium CG22_combo_CG10-13_8_21_14_all_38_13]PIQ54755.1 MAG: hypothetical protein COW01_09465 [Bdellovibrionales bacterium CG12_big_fil_rev_8_21_14_0_65_38_15]PIR31310.1 MAG: hypothetical protein COV38_01080 [Bdellovibrionales bacterium CG11_big_fil_rev_8_21_14_0_20_38_13]
MSKVDATFCDKSYVTSQYHRGFFGQILALRSYENLTTVEAFIPLCPRIHVKMGTASENMEA